MEEYNNAFKKLQSVGQQHLLNFWQTLSLSQKSYLLAQINSIDLATFLSQQELVKCKDCKLDSVVEPFSSYMAVEKYTKKAMGPQLISEGKVGCLLVAGGQGTRLHFQGPKGMFPITVIAHKSLFQLFAEKVIAAGRQANRLLHLAIMTSPINDVATRSFFEEHHLFGLRSEQLSFYSQGMLPLLDQNGNLFLEEPDRIAQGPDGNGSSLQKFISSGIGAQWQADGVRYVNYVLIDNPLADPFDAKLVEYHYHQDNAITVKCTSRQTPHEKVGLLVKKNKKVQVVEYSELSDKERLATRADGRFRHNCANISLFCFSMDFIQEVSTNSAKSLPLHLAFKPAKCVESAPTPHPAHIATQEMIPMMAWKFEKFIFDLLPLATKVGVLLYPRAACFSPLKSLEEEGSVASVQKALQQSDCEKFRQITGMTPPLEPFELAQDFYYPTPELLEQWSGKPIPSMYSQN